MRIVERKRFWTTLLVSAALAGLFAMGLTGTAAADEQKKAKAGRLGTGMPGMMPGAAPTEHLAQDGSGRMRSRMGDRGRPAIEADDPFATPGVMGGRMGGISGLGRPGMSGRRFVRSPQENLAELPLNEVLAMALSSQPGGKDLPQVENLVERTLAINPKMVAARAELQRAQANLQRIQLEVARNVIEIRARWEVARRAVERLEAKVNKDRENAKLARAYINARAELAQIERGLPLLAGSMAATPRSTPEHFTNWKKTAAAPTPQPAQQKMPKEFDQLVSFDFDDVTMEDVVNYLQDQMNVQFIMDHVASEEEGGFPNVTLSIKKVPLKDALQAIEDTTKVVRFVVRPYGVLVTNEDNAVKRFGQKPQETERKGGGMF